VHRLTKTQIVLDNRHRYRRGENGPDRLRVGWKPGVRAHCPYLLHPGDEMVRNARAAHTMWGAVRAMDETSKGSPVVDISSAYLCLDLLERVLEDARVKINQLYVPD
jgi:hypothetical protein